MRLKIKRYAQDVEGLMSYKTILGNLDGGTYNAINLYVAQDDRWKSWLAKVNWDEALGGSAITLLRVLEIHDPEASERSRLDSILKFFSDITDGTSPKLKRLAADMAVDVFDFLSYRGNQDALAYLSNALISNAESEQGLATIQAIMAPKSAPEATSVTCLYTELRKSISRQGDVKDWIEGHLPKPMRLKAYHATGYGEAIATASRNQRGKMLESDLGM